MSLRALALPLCILVAGACAPATDAPPLTLQRGLSALPVPRASHTATQLTQGTVLFLSEDVRNAELFNPDSGEFAAASPMKDLHAGLTATLLRTGEVLVAGGTSSERYDPATNTWTDAGALPAPMTGGHTATLLQDGRVLLVGSGVAAIYSPAGPKWSSVAAPAARAGHTATLLPDDGRVLVAGGGVASAELFDPVSLQWKATASLSVVRTGHTATLMPNGEVLVVAGGVPSRESFVPKTESWTVVGSSSTAARSFHTSTLLPNGTVFTVGGYVNGVAVASTEGATPALATASGHHTATLLRSGKVLITGGRAAPTGAALNRTELLAPLGPGSWTKTTGDMRVARLWHKSTVLRDGRVLVVGGFSGTLVHADSQIFDPATGTFGTPATLKGPGRDSFTLTTLQDGRVLSVGGIVGATPALANVEIYDPASNTWTATTPLPGPRTEHVAVLLGNGRVLVAGGEDTDENDLLSAVTFNPADNTWTPAGMTTPHNAASAVLLPDGTVLLAGGDDSNTAEIYNPASNTWAPAGSFTTARSDHMLTVLPNGKVLLAGGDGINNVLATCFLFTPPNTWTPTASLAAARWSFVQTLLPSGRVLVGGGRVAANATGMLDTTEIYDPLLGTWSAGPRMGVARGWLATADVLADGKVLVTGGETTGALGLSTAELFDEGLSSPFAPKLMDPLPAIAAGSTSWTVFGEGFTGLSGGEDAPVFTLSRLSEGTDGSTGVFPVRATGWSDTQARLALPAVLPAGRYWLRVSVRGVTSDAKPVSVISGTAQALSITTPPRMFAHATCGREQRVITVAGPAGAVFTAVSSSPGGTWYKDAACTEPGATFTVGANGTVGLFYKDIQAGAPRLGVNSATGLADPPPQSHLVDETPPTKGTLTAKLTETELSASWRDFIDPESGVRFEWALGTAEGLSDLVGFQAVGAQTSVTAMNLNLPKGGKEPFLSLLAVNGAGMYQVVNLGPLVLGEEVASSNESGCRAGPGGNAGLFGLLLVIAAWLRATRSSLRRVRLLSTQPRSASKAQATRIR